MKGVLSSLAPSATLIDITHSIAPGDTRVAAYVLSRVWHRYPRGTIHLAVVDPGVGTSRAALAFAAAGHLFVGPDNGLFGEILGRPDVEVVSLRVPPAASPTFHGRDLFAPAAAALARAEALDSVGSRFEGSPERLSDRQPHYEGKSVIGEVIYVDRFGNLITDLTPELVPSYAVLEVEDIIIGPLRRTYGDVPTGGLLAYLGSGGTVEIGVRDGSAARRLGLGIGGKVRARLG